MKSRGELMLFPLQGGAYHGPNGRSSNKMENGYVYHGYRCKEK
jgi:hypothetical protein